MTSSLLTIHESEVLRAPAPRSGYYRPGTAIGNIFADVRAIWTGLPLWSWLIPTSGLCLLGLLGCGQLLPWFVGKYAWTGKDCQEVLGPSLLAAAVLVATLQWAMERSFCRGWMLALPAVLLCRELHFPGTGTGVYVGLAALTLTAVRHRARLQPVWNCSSLGGWWFGALSWYVLAVSIDSGAWKFLPHAHWWSVNLEETLESGGHFCILLGTLSSVVMVASRPKSARKFTGQ